MVLDEAAPLVMVSVVTLKLWIGGQTIGGRPLDSADFVEPCCVQTAKTVQCSAVNCDALCCRLEGRSCSGGTTALACSRQELINKLCFWQISAALCCGAIMRGGRRSENNRAVLSDPFEQPRNTKKNMQ